MIELHQIVYYIQLNQKKKSSMIYDITLLSFRDQRIFKNNIKNIGFRKSEYRTNKILDYNEYKRQMQ